MARAKTALAPTPIKQPPTLDDQDALLQRFSAGDKAAEKQVVRRMRQDRLWAESIAQLSSTLRCAWIKYAAPEEDFTREVFTARARTMKRNLLGDNPSPLESLLAERIVICHIALEMAECDYMQKIRQEGTFKRVLFYEHLMDRASRRYIHAVKALAQVRRLQLPVVAQFNVAENQVNVSAASDAPADPARTHVA